jgi:peroxiredoxin
MIKTLLTIVTLLISTQSFALDRTTIAADADLVTPLLNGQTLPDAKLMDTSGNSVSLQQLTDGKATLIIFYRGGWCPYCSRQLAELKDVEAALVAQGIQLLAISPDSPERLQQTQLKTETPIKLLSDPQMEAIRNFGLGFYLDDKTADRYRGKLGVEFVSLKNESKVALPVPAVYLVNSDGLIVFNYVNPNFKVRVSANLLLSAAQLVLE